MRTYIYIYTYELYTQYADAKRRTWTFEMPSTVDLSGQTVQLLSFSTAFDLNPSCSRRKDKCFVQFWNQLSDGQFFPPSEIETRLMWLKAGQSNEYPGTYRMPSQRELEVAGQNGGPVVDGCQVIEWWKEEVKLGTWNIHWKWVRSSIFKMLW